MTVSWCDSESMSSLLNNGGRSADIVVEGMSLPSVVDGCGGGSDAYRTLRDFFMKTCFDCSTTAAASV